MQQIESSIIRFVFWDRLWDRSRKCWTADLGKGVSDIAN